MHQRFFVDFKIGNNQRVELSDEELLHQLTSVFRVKLGDKIVLLDNSGFEYNGIIKGISKKEIIIQINNRKEGEMSDIEINIFQSILKKDSVEFIFEKCTEIGVSRFVPVLAEHSIKLNLNYERLRKIVKEASEQCGRAKLPEISEIINFENAVAIALRNKEAVNFIFHEEKNKCCGKLSCDFLKNFPFSACHPDSEASGEGSSIKKFNLFIGPEGGFSDKEIELVKKNGFYILSLGNLVLRSETAAIVASYAILNF